MCSATQSCLTVCDPIDYSPLGSFVHGIFHTRILKQVAISLHQGIVPIQELNLCLLHLLHWQVGSLPRYHLGSPTLKIKGNKIPLQRDSVA